MIEKKQNSKMTIDLTGPQGNAYYILGVAKQLCTQLNMDWLDIQKQMMSGDYENLVKVFDDEFGDYVTLYR